MIEADAYFQQARTGRTLRFDQRLASRRGVFHCRHLTTLTAFDQGASFPKSFKMRTCQSHLISVTGVGQKSDRMSDQFGYIAETKRLRLDHQRSAKPLCVGSIPTRASKFFG